MSSSAAVSEDWRMEKDRSELLTRYLESDTSLYSLPLIDIFLRAYSCADNNSRKSVMWWAVYVALEFQIVGEGADDCMQGLVLERKRFHRFLTPGWSRHRSPSPDSAADLASTNSKLAVTVATTKCAYYITAGVTVVAFPFVHSNFTKRPLIWVACAPQKSRTRSRAC